MSEESAGDLKTQRLEKLAALRDAGVDVYPNRFARELMIGPVLERCFPDGKDPAEEAVMTAGRIMAKRDMGKAAFLHIRDATGQLQVYANNKTLDEADYAVFQLLDLGDIVGVEGEPFITKTGEATLRARQLKILSKNLSPIPVVKEKDGHRYDAFSDVETRYRKRYLDLVVNPEVREDFELRSRIVFEIRSFLNEKGFLEVETPMMQSIASGAAARPFATHHNTLDMPLYLRVAPELYLKRLIVGGFDRVFELNRNFRNEGVSTKHNPEFTMLELYQAFGDYKDMMQITEELFIHLADKLLGSRKLPYGDETISLEPPWQKKSYLQAIVDEAGVDFHPFLSDENPDKEKAKSLAKKAGVDVGHCNTFWEVVDEVFSEKVEPTLIQPVFITDFPKAISPLAKNIPGDAHLVERFEPYIVGREVGNAFSELNDPHEQKARFEQQQVMKEEGAEETMPMDEDFIEALSVGMPPTGGLGIGIDRLVMLFTNSPSIKDVILFPLQRARE